MKCAEGVVRVADQAKGKPELLRHIQGALALTDLGPAEQRTQIAVPKPNESAQSLRYRMLEAFPADPDAKKGFDPEREEWIAHTEEDKRFLAENADAVLPCLKKGQMLLWASGMAHASVPGALPEGQTERMIRASTFTSCVPRELVSTDEIAYRRNLLEKSVTSGHRVCEPGQKGKFRQCLFGKNGRTYGKELPPYDTSLVLKNFKVYSGLKRGRDEEEIDKVAPSKVHRAMARMCGGYRV